MAGFNQCTFVGNLGADPEIRSLNSGDRICNLRLAVSETWRDKTSGERKERTEWVRFTIYNEGLVKVAESYLRKGSKVLLQGQMQTRKYTDQSGAEKFSTEIVLQKFGGVLQMLDGKPEGGGQRGGGGGGESQSGGYGGSGGQRQQEFSADLDDEIPF